MSDPIDIRCTGIAASWCPIHGDCTCRSPEDSKSDDDCPLHGPESTHPDEVIAPSGLEVMQAAQTDTLGHAPGSEA